MVKITNLLFIVANIIMRPLSCQLCKTHELSVPYVHFQHTYVATSIVASLQTLEGKVNVYFVIASYVRIKHSCMECNSVNLYYAIAIVEVATKAGLLVIVDLL